MFGGGGQQTVSTSAPIVANLRIQTSAYGRRVPVVLGTARLAGNLIDYDDFTAIPHTTVTQSGGASSGGKGGGRGGVTQENTTYTYTAMVLLALCSGGPVSIGQVWRDKQQGALASFFTDLFTGTGAQSAWGYLSTNHSGKALAYRSLAYVAHAALDLGPNANIGNFSFEVTNKPADYGGRPDAAVKDVITQVLTNTVYGLALPGGILGDYTALHNYCGANDIWVSPAYTEPEMIADVLKRLAAIANAGPFWSEDKLKLVPYGDTALTANGFTFTPSLTPLYDWGDSDYLDKEQPVRLVQKTPADAYNYVIGKFFNRANQYNEQPVQFKDQADIEASGLKPDPNERVYHEICLASSAQAVIDAEGRRVLYGTGNTYETRVNAKYDLCEPMDLVTLTDAALDLDHQLVRIISIEEDSEEGLNVVCEEVAAGTASPASYSSQAPGGYAADFNVAPGNVNTPVFVVAPYELTDGWPQVWMGLAGGTNFGGCEVWVSDGGASYRQLGIFSGRSRMGVTTSQMNVQADPDNTTTLGVDLSSSKGTLLSGTQQDANNYNTLCYVGGELIAYKTASLTGTNTYNLSGLRRGAYGSPVKQVASGAQFLRMDDTAFKTSFPPEFQGRTLSFKFLAFNQYKAAKQALADVSPYTLTLSQKYVGVPPMLMVSGLELFGQGLDTSFTGRDAKFVWRRSSRTGSYGIGSEPQGGGDGYLDPYFKDYRVEISKTDGTVLRTEFVQDPLYTYTWEKNFEDNAGVPVRAFVVKVWQRGTQNQLSALPAPLPVSNPVPAAPGGIAIVSGSTGSALSCTFPAGTDIAGMQVWRSTSAGFTPGPGNLVYDGPDNTVSFQGLAVSTAYYYRVAVYDTFGKSGLNVSSEISSTTSFTIGGIEIVTSLPTPGTNGRVVYLTSDGLLYKDNGLLWKRAVDGVDLTDGTVTAQKILCANLAAINADLGNITAGTITLNTAGHIKSGATAYATGSGWWIGFDGGEAAFYFGDGSTEYVKYKPSTGLLMALKSFNINLAQILSSIVANAWTDEGAGSIYYLDRYDVCFGSAAATNSTNGLFVMVGDKGAVIDGTDKQLYWSDDGSTWGNAQHVKNFALNSVCEGSNGSGGKQICAVGEADGTDAYIVTNGGSGVGGGSWSERANAKNITLRSVCWSPTLGSGSGRYCAVGDPDGGSDVYIITSDNGGASWTERSGTGEVATLYSVVWDATLALYIAVGKDGSNLGYIATSPDGITWTKRTFPSLSNSPYATAVGSDGKGNLVMGMIFTSGPAVVALSTDGTSWSTAGVVMPRINGTRINKIIHNGSMWLAVGKLITATGATVLSSAAGKRWTFRPNPQPYDLNGVAWSGTTFVGAGNKNTVAGSRPYIARSLMVL